MKVDRVEWLRESRQTTSYRRMYGLVVLIIASSSSSMPERRAAEQMRDLLEEVVELAIAPAAILNDIRHGFMLLTDIVADAQYSPQVAKVA